MSDWNAGYVTDIGYTFGYYTELNPLRIQLAFLNAGIKAPETGTACELGFGQGVSTVVHAAASTVAWSGTDFNPAQAAFARDLNLAAGSNAQLFDDAFADFCARPELPDFDFIALHGIWSWISDENRHVIVDFVRRKLKVGGVLYISYNTLPGWSAVGPLRKLLAEHASTLSAEGVGVLKRVDDAIAFTDKLLATNPLYARINTQVAPRFEKLKEQNRQYLAHEYFNEHWLPMYFADMAQWLEPAKLTYACSANYLDAIDAINLSAEQLAMLKEIEDPLFRQTVRDYMVNQQFRKDYWVKGAVRLSPLEQVEALLTQRVMLGAYRPGIELTVKGALGDCTLSESIYNPILDLLADYQPRTIGQIEQLLQAKSIARGQLFQAVMVLAGMGCLVAVQDDKTIGLAQKHTAVLNQRLMMHTRSSNDITVLASPVTGGGVTVFRIQQLFLLAISRSQKQPADWANFVWQILSAQKQGVLKEGKALQTAEENTAELLEQANTFAEKQLPMLKALKVI